MRLPAFIPTTLERSVVPLPFQAFVRSRAFSSPPSFCLKVNVWTETYEQPLIHSTIRRAYIHSFIHSFNTFVPHEDTGRLSRRYAPGNLLTVLYNVITSIPSLLFLPSESGLRFIKFHGSTPYNRKFLDNLISFIQRPANCRTPFA